MIFAQPHIKSTERPRELHSAQVTVAVDIRLLHHPVYDVDRNSYPAIQLVKDVLELIPCNLQVRILVMLAEQNVNVLSLVEKLSPRLQNRENLRLVNVSCLQFGRL